MGIDRQQWTARGPGPTGLRARIEQVAELVEPVELPPPAVEDPEAEGEVVAVQDAEPAPPEQPATSAIRADLPRWRTNAAFASRLEAASSGDGEPAPVEADEAGEQPADPSASDAA